MRKLKNQIFNVMKLLLIVHILISSGAALYGQITGLKIDPIKAILYFQTQPQDTANETTIKDAEYTAWQKLKSTVYGAIGTDYTVVGDFRDLAIEGWKYLSDEEMDEIVITLSTSGIILSVVPMLYNAIYLKGFKMNPIVILGLSRSHVLIHTLKILKKYNLVGGWYPCSVCFSFYLYCRRF